MKIICAGFQKTGTKTVAEALRILGFNVHDVFQQYFYEKELWKKLLNNETTRDDYVKAFKDVDAVTDFPANAVWEEILNAFPDSKVILTVRSSEDEWFESVRNHFKVASKLVMVGWSDTLLMIVKYIAGPLNRDFTNFTTFFMNNAFGTKFPWGIPPEPILRSRYRQHNMYVKRRCPENQLLTYNVKDGWEPLCNFLGVSEPDIPFPRKNVASSFIQEVTSNRGENDSGFSAIAHKQLVSRVLLLVVVLLGVVYSLIYHAFS